jgi:hypothetical protein
VPKSQGVLLTLSIIGINPTKYCASGHNRQNNADVFNASWQTGRDDVPFPDSKRVETFGYCIYFFLYLANCEALFGFEVDLKK